MARQMLLKELHGGSFILSPLMIVSQITIPHNGLQRVQEVTKTLSGTEYKRDWVGLTSAVTGPKPGRKRRRVKG